MSTHLLCIEDSPNGAKLIERVFESMGIDVTTAEDGERGLELALSDKFDVVVLDRRLPGLSGIEIVSRMRREQVFVPVLMLSGMAGVTDRIEGLEAGADDYLVKPFEVKELVARVQALLRRRGSSTYVMSSSTVCVGPLEMDMSSRAVQLRGKPIQLTPTEFDVLALLMRFPGRALSRRFIQREIWDGVSGRSNIVDVYVGYLRRKIDDPSDTTVIETVRGVGYRLRASEVADHPTAEENADV